MADRIVINTGPLIALARADALDVIARLPLELLTPEAVRHELQEGVRLGHAPVVAPWLHVTALRAPVDPMVLVELGPGEAGVIALAREQAIGVVAIDERKGRRAALAVGLRVTGTLGLLGAAKRHGIIPAVRPFLDKLSATGAGWFDPALLANFLAGMGE